MSSVPATPTTMTTALPHIEAGLAGPTHDNQPQYRHVGGGRFLPANKEAHEEVRRWNEFATFITARSAASRGARS